jgi:pseudouridine synthase
VGRLDFHTEGLLLLTNDGSLTHSLLHPKFHIARVYQAKVEGIPESASLKLLREGMRTGGERMWADRVEVVRRTKRNAWLAIEIRQGKYHQIRRMCEGIGHPVLKLRRIRLGPIHLGPLPRGRWRWLKPEEVERLKALVMASGETRAGKKDTWND